MGIVLQQEDRECLVDGKVGGGDFTEEHFLVVLGLVEEQGDFVTDGLFVAV